MSKLDKLAINAKIKKDQIVGGIKDKMTRKSIGDDKLVVTLVLIVIAVIIIVVFQEQITKAFNDVMKQFTGDVGNIINGGDVKPSSPVGTTQ